MVETEGTGDSEQVTEAEAEEAVEEIEAEAEEDEVNLSLRFENATRGEF